MSRQAPGHEPLRLHLNIGGVVVCPDDGETAAALISQGIDRHYNEMPDCCCGDEQELKHVARDGQRVKPSHPAPRAEYQPTEAGVAELRW